MEITEPYVYAEFKRYADTLKKSNTNTCFENRVRVAANKQYRAAKKVKRQLHYRFSN